jgi:hypothetical protein
MRAALTILAALLLATSARAADGAPRRFAIVSGASDGGTTRSALRYSTSDARQVARVLRRLGGVALDDLLLVEEPDAGALRAALAKVAGETGRAREAGQRVELFLYFSGHSDESGLLLGKTQLPYAELRAELERVPADVRVAILDSCSSGAITRAKGGVHRPPFLLDASSNVKGHAFLTSSAADEASQESDRLKGSFFTHALLTGLRGGADASNDGVVTLNEAYQFAFRETLARTETTQGGPQHATYDIGLVGSGDVVMTDLRRADAVLVIPTALEGTVFVRNAAGQLVAELRKLRGAGVELALEEGRYDVRVSFDRRVSSTSVELASSSRVVLDAAKLAAIPLEATALRGDGAAPIAIDPGTRAIASASPAAVRSSWGSFAAGSTVPQFHQRGDYGLQLQASAGTWLRSFVGVEASVGYSRIAAEGWGQMPVLVDYGTGSWATFGSVPVRETLTSVPLSVTVKLALPTATLRAYLLAGAGLQFVHVRRALVGDPVQPGGGLSTTTVTSDRFSYDLVVPSLHAGLGAAFRLSPRFDAIFEGRYQYARQTARENGQYVEALDLAAIQLTAGVGYTF